MKLSSSELSSPVAASFLYKEKERGGEVKEQLQLDGVEVIEKCGEGQHQDLPVGGERGGQAEVGLHEVHNDHD